MQSKTTIRQSKNWRVEAIYHLPTKPYIVVLDSAIALHLKGWMTSFNNPTMKTCFCTKNANLPPLCHHNLYLANNFSKFALITRLTFVLRRHFFILSLGKKHMVRFNIATVQLFTLMDYKFLDTTFTERHLWL